MTMDLYQDMAHATAVMPKVYVRNEKDEYVEVPALYPVLGLSGEGGEIANKTKKIIRDTKGILSPAQKEDIVDEMGDVLWYVAELCTALDVKLENVAHRNLGKLSDRKKRNVIQGEGDKR